MKSVSFKDLTLWQKSMSLTKRVYAIMSNMPKEEKYGLISQTQRASVSISANIAEGQARKGNKEFIQFLYIAKGSLAELETLLLLCEDIYKLNSEKLTDIYNNISECNKMTAGLIKSLKGDNA